MNKIVNLISAVILGMVLSSAAWSYVIEQDGLEMQVSYAKTGQTISFNVVADFTGATTHWVGDTMDAFSLQFYGNKPDRIDSFTGINYTNTSGVWSGLLDKVSGQGCYEDDHLGAVCYTVDPTKQGGDGATVIENDVYYWAFDVTFADGLNLDNMLNKDHSVKFLSVAYKDKQQKWKVGTQFSQSGRFVPAVAEPATIALFCIGLFGLFYARKLAVAK